MPCQRNNLQHISDMQLEDYLHVIGHEGTGPGSSTPSPSTEQRSTQQARTQTREQHSPDPPDPERNTPVQEDLEMNTHLGDGETDSDVNEHPLQRFPDNDGNDVNNTAGDEDTQADPPADIECDVDSDNVLSLLPNLQTMQEFIDALRDTVLNNSGMELDDLDCL
ncbi:hypothetical protein EI94DRAFT_1819812 [Lactarius quietus]|nr:hypothetical protein EI94DRAFT_1819812 [Lactarius quietus]